MSDRLIFIKDYLFVEENILYIKQSKQLNPNIQVSRAVLESGSFSQEQLETPMLEVMIKGLASPIIIKDATLGDITY